jgi:hypothetical protein
VIIITIMDIIQQYILVGGCAQVVECLPGKHRTLSSNPVLAKKERVIISLGVVALACKLSYSGGRGQRTPADGQSVQKLRRSYVKQ